MLQKASTLARATMDHGRSTMAETKKIQIPIAGMDCAECTEHVHHALAALPGVESAQVLLTSEKAIVRFDPTLVDLNLIRRAVESAGYSVPNDATSKSSSV